MLHTQIIAISEFVTLNDFRIYRVGFVRKYCLEKYQYLSIHIHLCLQLFPEKNIGH